LALGLSDGLASDTFVVTYDTSIVVSAETTASSLKEGISRNGSNRARHRQFIGGVIDDSLPFQLILEMLDGIWGIIKHTRSLVKMLTADLGDQSALSIEIPRSPMIQLVASLLVRTPYASLEERPRALAKAMTSAAATICTPARC
jgi:hypothetical protein